jgi:5'(3')-deoxyribonucleotidase
MIDPATLAFDIDGVVADTMALFLEIARDVYQIDGIRYENISCYDLASCTGLDQGLIDAVVERILDGNYTAPLNSIEGAPDVLTRIGNHCSPLLFVTARPYLGPIRDWMSALLPDSYRTIEVVATGSFANKAEVLLEKNIATFVEDRLDTCYRLQDAGIRPILFKQPWNREPHPFVEVGSWKDLEILIDFPSTAKGI